MMFKLTNKYYSVNIDTFEHGATVSNGEFGEIKLLSAPIFDMRIKKLSDNESFLLSSSDGWDSVTVKENNGGLSFCFKKPLGIDDICVFVNATVYDCGINWASEVVNDNSGYSVMDITYPTPKMTGDYLNYFIPQNSGFVLDDAGNRNFSEENFYPSWRISMQYFAVYGRNNGIYIGFEDDKAASKLFKYECKDGNCELTAEFTAIGAGLPANSFRLYGKCNWRFFNGDWYDAAQIYSDFVQHNADWLPEIGENGREDLSEKFKNVPFWICDYMPNSKYQGDNKPMNLSAGSDIYDEDYWYKAPIALQKELGVPIAYHVYNWHEIPFNIEYPHFCPAKKEFTEHIKELQDNNIYVLPYINAVGWEMNDDEGGHDVNFKNTGCKSAIMKENGGYVIEEYPQHTKSGKICNLAPICGSSAEWHKIIEKLTRELENTLDVDGIYFDEVSAAPASPCYNREHNHLPGGGSYYIDGYNSMMKKINAEKPDGAFYFSECNAEPFMKSFNGYLTWMWVMAGEVPAFAVIYSGYIQLLGRCTIGNKKDDFEFFKYCTAKSLLCGQQLGWCKADIVYSRKHMDFLKRAVNVRCKYTDVFNRSRMLRPPIVKTDLPKYVTKAGISFDGNIVSEQVLGGAWRYRSGNKVFIFAANISEKPVNYNLSFSTKEYGLDKANLPREFVKESNNCTVSGKLSKYEIKVWEIDC